MAGEAGVAPAALYLGRDGGQDVVVARLHALGAEVAGGRQARPPVRRERRYLGRRAQQRLAALPYRHECARLAAGGEGQREDAAG
jgi:hypothetical protein